MTQSKPLYPLPFTPRYYYYIPYRWLGKVTQAAELDCYELLLTMESDGNVLFPHDQDVAYWTRKNDENLPNVVSHTTFGKVCKDLINRGWLLPLSDDAVNYFSLTEWSELNSADVIYKPRSYITERWPARLVHNKWETRMALLALMVHMAQQYNYTNQTTSTGADILVTETSREQLKAIVQRFPIHNPEIKAKIVSKMGQGLDELTSLNLITSTKKRANNRWYQFQSDAFERIQEPTLEDIAKTCGLNLEQDTHWVELVATFLRYNCRPLTEASQVWKTIRKHSTYLNAQKYVVTAKDAQTLIVLIQQKAGHAATTPKKILKDYVKSCQEEAKRHWDICESFQISLAHELTQSPSLHLFDPQRSNRRLEATQLEVNYVRHPRLSYLDAQELALGTRIEIRQQEQIITPGRILQPDRYDIQKGHLLDYNHLHTRLDYTQPLQLLVHAAQPTPRLTLSCSFRQLYS